MRPATLKQPMSVTKPTSKSVLDDLLKATDFTGALLVPQVIADDLSARRAIGIERYNTELQTDNGRDCLVDLRQELLDGIMYSHQAVMEGHRVAHIRNGLVKMLVAMDEQEQTKW